MSLAKQMMKSKVVTAALSVEGNKEKQNEFAVPEPVCFYAEGELLLFPPPPILSSISILY